MISKQRLRDILVEGRSLNSQKYFKSCVVNHVKTFYFFLRATIQRPCDSALASTELNEYIVAQLRDRKIEVNNQFNPQGWFGKAWTDWVDPSKNETNFKSEYLDVLARTGSDPYSYQIRPECLSDVVEIFHGSKGRLTGSGRCGDSAGRYPFVSTTRPVNVAS